MVSNPTILASIVYLRKQINVHTKQADTFHIATTYLTKRKKSPKNNPNFGRAVERERGELWSASAASCGTRVQWNNNPNEKMEKNETICVSAPLKEYTFLEHHTMVMVD